MQIVLENIDWMIINLALAMLGFIFGWLFFYTKKRILSFTFFILWVIFIPNSVYLVTDLQHLPEQWVEVSLLAKLLLLVEYGLLAFLGVVTFIVSMYPVDKIFSEFNLKRKNSLKLSILILVNLFIAFALILGKFQRTHSWYIFTDFSRVILDIATVFKTPILLALVFFFGIVINLTYFGFKNIIHISLNKRGR
ncbi:DUF1361 domain-containing protein [Candidatus Daviesbacteria bacterium]|nr:DUF1361 domain-containing protein [Candidatus Daviesbacteria bacterium]